MDVNVLEENAKEKEQFIKDVLKLNGLSWVVWLTEKLKTNFFFKLLKIELRTDQIDPNNPLLFKGDNYLMSFEEWRRWKNPHVNCRCIF